MMRPVYCLLFAILCVAGSPISRNGIDKDVLARAEAFERRQLQKEDMLMVNHLRSLGIFVDTSRAIKHTD